VNLFSVNNDLKNDFKIRNEDIIIHTSKGSATLSFESVVKTKNGIVSGVRLNPVPLRQKGIRSRERNMKSNLI
jgi:hypothetical protein